MRFRSLIFLLLLPGLCLAGCRPPACADPLGCLQIPPGQPLRVGLLLPLSGPQSADSLRQREAIEQTLLDTGDLGGHALEVIAVDSDCAGAGDARAATELVLQDGMAVVLGAACPDGVGAAILTDAGLTLVPLSSPDPVPDAQRLFQSLRSVATRDLSGWLSIPRGALRAELGVSE